MKQNGGGKPPRGYGKGAGKGKDGGARREGGGYGGDRPSYGEKKQYGEKKSYGDKPSYGGGKPSYGDKPSYGGGKKPSYGDKPPYGDKPAYGGGKPSYGDRPSGRGKPPYRPAEERGGYERRDERPRPERRPAPPVNAPRSEAVVRDTVPPASPNVPPENMLVGRNPIREALKAGRHFEALYVAKGDINGSAREIVRKAKDARILVKEVDRRALDAMSPGHQGLVAIVSAHQYSTVEDMLSLAKRKGEDPLIVLLDGITDPHNFGAIARTAECGGAHGVIVCERRAVGMTPGAAKAAAGAFEHIPVARVTNIARAIDDLKKQGLWVYAADQEGDSSYYGADLKGPVALVVGDEGEGVSRLALEKCDARVSIPIRGEIESLNASVAAGILLYEVVRQRARM